MLLRDVVVNCELVSRAKLYLVSVFPDIVKNCPKIRNFPKIFRRSFENVAPGFSLGERVYQALPTMEQRYMETALTYRSRLLH